LKNAENPVGAVSQGEMGPPARPREGAQGFRRRPSDLLSGRHRIRTCRMGTFRGTGKFPNTFPMAGSPPEASDCDRSCASGRGKIAKSTKSRRRIVLPPPSGATTVAHQSHGLRRGLLSFALTGFEYRLRVDFCDPLRNRRISRFHVAQPINASDPFSLRQSRMWGIIASERIGSGAIFSGFARKGR